QDDDGETNQPFRAEPRFHAGDRGCCAHATLLAGIGYAAAGRRCVMDAAMVVRIRQQDVAPASSTPIERSPRRAARPIRACKSLVASLPVSAAAPIVTS